MKNIFTAFAVIGVTAIVGTIAFTNSKVQENVPVKAAFAATTAIVYKSPTCGCCEGHARAMQEAGIDVEIVETSDLVSIKDNHSIPIDMQACHTTILSQGENEYIVEGHVPLEGIEALFEKSPDIAGITLPGMPSGTPGMPGPKTGPHTIMTLEEEPQLFLSL